MVLLSIIGQCSIDATTNKRKCKCSEGWGGDYCRKKVCYQGYCLNNSKNIFLKKNVNIRHLTILNANVETIIRVNDVKMKFVKQIHVMVRVILLCYIGQCRDTTGQRVCVCNPGYALPFCAQKSCDNFQGCNNGKD